MKPASLTPTTLVIFGATGDLARTKLLPALFELYTKKLLPPTFQIVGLAKEPKTTSTYRQFARRLITDKKREPHPRHLDSFINRIHYQSGDFNQLTTYKKLARRLATLDQNQSVLCSNKLFYLATPPKLYDTIFENLSQSGLTIPCGGPDGWTRILVEKPFGHNLTTAQALDKKLGQLFQEEQIFRIDHYLAKETVQNILTFRFTNALFEPLWNRHYIKQIHISVWETAGVGQRGSFYEDIGALRDVGQNHLLQMLALIAMEEPTKLTAKAIRTARGAVLEQLVPIPPEHLHSHITRGQYQGYRDEQAVGRKSETETYFRMNALMNNPRWQGVPFILESGKRLSTDKVEIKIVFKKKKQQRTNTLTIRIQPDEGISLVFWAKKPGLTSEVESKTLSFLYKDTQQVLPDAYQRVLYDCIRGDQTLFASTEEVTAAWNFITPILKNWHTLPLHAYQPGSAGPTLSTPAMSVSPRVRRTRAAVPQ